MTLFPPLVTPALECHHSSSSAVRRAGSMVQKTRILLGTAVALLCGAAVPAAAGEAPNGQDADQAVAVVTTYKYQFNPPTLTIRAGTQVRWENKEKIQYHNVWFKELNEEPGVYLFPGESMTRSFDTPGVYPYVCQPHEDRGMKGVIEVVGP